MKYFGVLVPLVTPCSRSGDIDLRGVRAVCDDMLGAGSTGLFLMGSTGRGPWFGREDRARLCKAVTEHVGPDVPIFAGCMDNGLKQMVEHAKGAADAGAHFAVVTPPGYFQYEQHEIETILMRFADASPLKVLLYDVPVYTGSQLALDSITRLMRHGNIVGMKDSTADEGRLQEVLGVIRDAEGVYFLQGKEHLLATTMLSGGSGVVTTFSHFLPRPFVTLCGTALSGGKETAEAIQRQITRLYQLVVGCLEKRPGISTLFHMVNIALQRRSVCRNIMLEHEGECPGWLREETARAMEISEAARRAAG
ncbi:MAG: dihydrodipicolinate synthase family protein [Bacteroidota bacterium]